METPLKTENDYQDSVFVNCPFDNEYFDMFKAIIFTVTHCGFYVRCTLEESDSSKNRLSKIMDIISECRYSIHDISRTEIDATTSLPRFNMPLELGIFIGAKKFGAGDHQTKQCLILDTQPYRYQKFISDISGQDIEDHNNDNKKVIRCVRNWLANKSGDRRLCSGSIIYADYLKFLSDLPELCRKSTLDIQELTFCDINYLINEWCHYKNVR
jgi:hypothetical protein